MTRPDLDALTAMLAAATPGPWRDMPRNDNAPDAGAKVVGDGWTVAACDRREAPWSLADAALIAAAVNALPGLLAVAKAALGCGNRPCILHVGPYVGMHTNGGCHCRQRIAAALAAVPS